MDQYMIYMDQYMDYIGLIWYTNIWINIWVNIWITRPGKRLHNELKIHHFLMGKFDISMAIVTSFLLVYQRVIWYTVYLILAKANSMDSPKSSAIGAMVGPSQRRLRPASGP